ncbi:MAG: hypothetical protein HC824_04985 [Synechococcales cyanobacterium RM1_1_8]|nr:hypothetical protein [Synechococcales cyanobacterium RM1_1_8]
MPRRGLIWTPAGVALAQGAGYGAGAMAAMADFFAKLPGANFALGQLALVQVVAFYGLLALVRLSRAWRKRWWIGAILLVIVIALPLQLGRTGRVQLTVLADTPPVLVVQDRGEVGLINCGNVATVRGQVVPFLQQQGINHLDWAISTQGDNDSREGWLRLLPQISVGQFFDAMPIASLPVTALPSPGADAGAGTVAGSGNKQPGQPEAGSAPPASQRPWIQQALEAALAQQNTTYGRLQPGQSFPLAEGMVSIDGASDRLWHYRRGSQTWLWLFQLDMSQQDALVKQANLEPADLLWWSGESIAPTLVDSVQPKVAIAAARTLDPDTLRLLASKSIPVYWTGRDGAVQWTPAAPRASDTSPGPGTIRPSRESLEIDTSPL